MCKKMHLLAMAGILAVGFMIAPLQAGATEPSTGNTASLASSEAEELIEKNMPEVLYAHYNQSFSEIDLPEGWSWPDPNILINEHNIQDFGIGYVYVPARFDVSQYDDIDFSDVQGYDPQGEYVDMLIEMFVAQAPNFVSYKDGFSLDKVYDGKSVEVSADDVVISAGVGTVRFTYQEKRISNHGTEYWVNIDEAPSHAGSYRIYTVLDSGSNYYASDTMHFYFDIQQATPAYTLPENLSTTQGNPLASIALPEGFQWLDETELCSEAGHHRFKAIYTPEDTTNYQTVEVELDVKVMATSVSVDQSPMIAGDEVTLTVGDTFDWKKYVTATDTEDGNLTDQIQFVSQDVDTSKPGTYAFTVQVTDSQGNTTTKTIAVSVNAPVQDSTSTEDIVQTNDPTSLTLWTGSFLLFAAALVILWFKRPKQSNNA